MKNKNLFILLFSFVAITSFAADKIKAGKKHSAKNVVKKEKKKDGGKEFAKQEAKEKPSADLIESAGKDWELVEDKQGPVKEAAKENIIQKPEVFLIDKIDSVIYGPEETSIITKSDLDKTGLDGQKRTKDKMIFELQVFQDAKKYNIMDEKLVDKYIEAIQSQQNLSLEEIKKMFYEFGYTYEEGREQLGMYNTINQLMDYKVRSKVMVPEKEVKEYYDANPVNVEETYTLQRIFVPVAECADLDKEKINIESKLKSGEVIVGADYSEHFSVEKPELADDKRFIASMGIGLFSDPVFVELQNEVSVDRGFEVFKLIDRKERHLATFEQRYREITDLLMEPLYDKLYEEYKNSLTKDSVVIELQ